MIAEQTKQETASYADKLRQLADWIDEHEVPDKQIAGISLGLYSGTPELTLRGHDLLREVFAGHKAKSVRQTIFDELLIEADGIRFRGWKSRAESPPPIEKEVTL